LFFIFREVSRFIAAGRLHAKIDKVGRKSAPGLLVINAVFLAAQTAGVIETNRPDPKTAHYKVRPFCGKLFFLLLQIMFLSVVPGRYQARRFASHTDPEVRAHG
jgi:hypothetical protein